MKTRFIYLVIFSTIADGVMESEEMNAYADEEKALETFKKWCDKDRIASKNDGWEIEENEHSYYSYLDGWAIDNHTTISCRKVELK